MPTENPIPDAPDTSAGESPASTLTGEDASKVPPAEGTAGETGGEAATSGDKASGEKSTDPAEKPAGGEDAKAPETPKAPETYDFTPPEGMEIDKEALSSYEDLAREHGLSQEQFDAITKHGLAFFQDRLTGLAEQQAARQQGWRNEALKDKTLSDGQALKPEVMANVGHVFDQFGGEDNALRTALIETGAGNHPGVIRALNAIGKALGAAQTPDRGKPASELKDNSYEAIARRRYGPN